MLTPDEQRYLQLLERKAKAEKAKTNLIAFAEYINPDPNAPSDVHRSTYHAKRYHKVIGAALEEVANNRMSRLIINVPPRHGKSELASKTFIPWWLGNHPGENVLFATYNTTFAWDFGRRAREIMEDPLYRQIFPDIKIKAASVDRIALNNGSEAFFVGRGGTITGRGGGLIIIDDPLKGREEADSPVIREKLWSWYTQDIMSRRMTEKGTIVLIQTRWHEDDLPGRLTDPTNSFYVKKEAESWNLIDLPALAEDDDVLGREKGEPLWPERFGKEYLADAKRLDPRGFQALYQGRPAPDDGVFFDADDLIEYQPHELPPLADLKIYCASDHAVSLQQGRDRTCLLAAGVDDNDNIWILPDAYWRQASADQTVEQMLRMMGQHRPIVWWAERGHISQSIGPFLKKRMSEAKIYCAIDEVVPVKDKQTRAQSIRGRVAMHKVRFPAQSSWWQEARSEILKFPLGQHDDFVDALALIGLGLNKQVSPVIEKPEQREDEGTFGYMLKMTKQVEQDAKAAAEMEGW